MEKLKTLSLLSIIFITTCTVAMTQPRAIGGRLGHSLGISYQHQTSKKNMIQADIDLLGYGWGVQGTVTFNWIIPLKSWETVNWNLCTGIGIGGGYESGMRTLRGLYHGWEGGDGFIGIAGMIGLEWNFKFPLQLSVEYRPLIGPRLYRYYSNGGKKTYIDFYYRGLWTSAIAVGVRYKFGGK